MKFILLLSISIICLAAVHPNNKTWNFNYKYSIVTPNDIPHSEINDIYQDLYGFVWLATLDGLFRYDGYEYKKYSMNKLNGGISSNMILKVTGDKNGNIYALTYGRGISILHPDKNIFINFSLKNYINDTSNINTLMIDEEKNNIWLSYNDGFSVITLNNDKTVIEQVYSYKISSFDISRMNYIRTIYKDKTGSIWIGKNKSTEKVIKLKEKQYLSEIYNIPGHSIKSNDKGLFISGDSICFIAYSNNPVQKYDKPIKVSDEKAWHILLDNDSTIWIGGRFGVKLLIKSYNEVFKTQYCIDRNNSYIKNNNIVVSSLMKSNNNIWIGTRGNGAYYIKKSERSFQNYSPAVQNKKNILTRCLFEDSEQNLWIGDEQDGIFILPKNKNYDDEYLNIQVNQKEEDRAYAFEETIHKNGKRIWVGTSSPSYLIAIDSKSLKKIDIDRDFTHLMGFVFCIKKTDERTLWIGTYDNGLWKLKLDDNGNIKNREHFLNNNSSLKSNIIRSLYTDKQGNLWIGTDKGVNILHKEHINDKQPIFEDIKISDKSDNSLNNNYIQQILQINNGHFLIVTMENGLVDYNPKLNSIKYINENNKLLNNTIKTLIEDPQTGYIWISTNNGIAKYNFKENKIINYNKENGIKETEFWEICGIRRNNGDFIFGNRNGFVKFTPDDIKINNNKSSVFLTKLYINGIENDIISNYRPNKKIKLEYANRNFSIDFVGLDFYNPTGLTYKYKLEGFDKGWNTARYNQRKATYTNIPEGEYCFSLYALNNDNIKSINTASLNIEILPPFYRSKWAYLIYFIIMLIVIYISYLLIRFYYRKKKEIYMIQMDKIKSEEVTNYKLQFFTDISHEFRTPLTLMKIPIESLIHKAQKDNNYKYLEDLKVIKSNADSLRILIEELLEFRKIDNNKKSINLKTVSINKYLAVYYDLFKGLATKANINYIFSPYKEDLFIDIDSKLFEKVIINLLSNAFKYTTQGNSIELGVKRINNKALIFVQDNGNGISENDLPYIFDRYFQSSMNNGKQHTGSGIGLNLCKKIIELHNGNIKAESRHGEGACFSISIELSPEKVSDNEHKYCVQNIEYETFTDNVYIDEERNDGNSIDNKPLILVVEDNSQLRHQIQDKLKEQFNVITASNGVEGIDMCIENYPKIVISDIKMPEMDGIEMCKQIKSNEEISHIPVIMITANDTEQNQLESFNMGHADAYITKPFSIDTLISLIGSVIENREILKRKFCKESVIRPEKISKTQTDLVFTQEILKIIRKNMNNPELNIEMIAKEYGVSRIYLNKKIKALTGETANIFLRNIKLKYAAQLLAQSKLNVTEVAKEIGYNDVNTFKLRFKEKFGVTPAVYNENLYKNNTDSEV